MDMIAGHADEALDEDDVVGITFGVWLRLGDGL